jgi:hypothetical protein
VASVGEQTSEHLNRCLRYLAGGFGVRHNGWRDVAEVSLTWLAGKGF